LPVNKSPQNLRILRFNREKEKERERHALQRTNTELEEEKKKKNIQFCLEIKTA
jgi:hypothetical protein